MQQSDNFTERVIPRSRAKIQRDLFFIEEIGENNGHTTVRGFVGLSRQSQLSS